MMERSILIVGSLATLGLVATAVVSYLDREISLHLLLALASGLLLLFAHSWVILYLVGTGRVVRGAVREHSLGPSMVAETRGYKRRSLPWITLAVILVLATFIIGGGVYIHVVPTWVHHGLFWLTLVVQLWALWWERRVLAANEALLAGINRRLWG